ncbi:MAG: acyl carrier protein [Bacteroidota bacterium]
MTDIEKKVKAIIAKITDIDESKITPELNLGNDLGLDNLDIIDLILELRIEFNISITDEDAKGLHTVGDAVAYVEKALNENN